MRKSALLVAAMLTLPAAVALAQPAVPRNVLSIQPLNAVFSVFSGEYERAAGKSASWAIGGNYWGAGDSNDDVDYTSAEFKLRYYPNGVALEGFSFGGAVGFASVTGRNSSGGNESVGGPSIGVLLEYQWLMGVKKNFTVALGAGAKALNISKGDIQQSVTAKYPTLRISVGLAF